MRKLTHLIFTLLSPLSAADWHSEIITSQLRDPMEIALAPNGDIYIAEREGRILCFRAKTGATHTIATLPVTALRAADKNSEWAREDGVLGLTLDPAFSSNKQIYIYYSHPSELLNRLSRFTLANDGSLDLKSEQKLLDVVTDRRNRVCHHGGSLAFDKDGLLYLSTGDNTNPFESDGSSPTDDRPGREHTNAARSAGNTNDLRGKILRIKPTANGYDIPQGNLFPPGTAKTRPEIYIMGLRNPFRISLDPKTKTLYWGEVGPDAHQANESGPKGHDEVNQAKSAGNHGWPFVIADQQPYAMRDFANNKKIISTIDPSTPKNLSAANTGLTDLPPARPAIIYYPYSKSEKFPNIGEGGRNAMAGPVFYFDQNRPHNLFPQSEDGTLIIYDWSRSKAWKIKLDSKENIGTVEPLLDQLMHPMDMELAADGSLILLEYGRDWYFNFNGRIRRFTPKSSAAPTNFDLTKNPDASFSIKNLTDSESAMITWHITTGMNDQQIGTGISAALPANTKADEIRAIVTDKNGRKNIRRMDLTISDLPPINLELPNREKNLKFGQTISVHAKDVAANNHKNLIIRARYIPATGHDSGDITLTADAHKLATEKQCFACHQVNHTSIGPRYTDISLRYTADPDAAKKLREKLRNGSTGAWGEVPMPAQAAVNDADAQTLIAAILGLSQGMCESRGKDKIELTLPPAPPNATPGGAWEITAEATGHTKSSLRIPAAN